MLEECMCVFVPFCKHAILLEKKCVSSLYAGYRILGRSVVIDTDYTYYFFKYSIYLFPVSEGHVKNSCYEYTLHNYFLKVENLCFIYFEGFKKMYKGSW